MTDTLNLPKVGLRGSFWTADAEIIQLSDPRTNLALRTLFVDTAPRTIANQAGVLPPGTMLALCFVTRVTITPSQEPQRSYIWERVSGTKPDGKLSPPALKALLDSGQLALMLVQADPDGWQRKNAASRIELTCLAGEISLDVLQPRADARTRIYNALRLTPIAQPAPATRPGAARLLGAISVHASGISLYAEVTLPWDRQPVSGVFQLAQSWGRPSAGAFRLTFEIERLTTAEQAALRASWQRFNRYVNPSNPLNRMIDPPPTPTWVTLELANPLDIPQLFWQIDPWHEAPATLPLHFAGDEFSLLLSDQQPYALANPPTSLGRIVPREVTVVQDAGRLKIDVHAGDAAAPATGQLVYSAARTGDSWQEQLTLSGASVGFNPVETAHMLRIARRLPSPAWVLPADGQQAMPIDEPILWACMPLADGWAQLPIPNLTEQIYLDAQVAETDVPEAERSSIQGAVTFGNDQPSVLAAYPGEQPWNLTLTGARSVAGTWTLQRTGSGYTLTQATVTLVGPDAFLNGLFWLSLEQPTAADALPSFDNWISSLTAVPLRIISHDELFPPLVRLAFDTLRFELRPPAVAQDRPSAALKDWSFEYQVDGELLERLVDRSVLPDTSFSAYPPLVWRRHATLPMIQALPLTQTLSPPNHPSPSRQLVPFELETGVLPDSTIGVPRQWRFGVVGMGAASWPRLLTDARPAKEWRSLFDLPLVALSLPGLILDPNPEGTPIATDPGIGLPIQYRFDVPYADELQALAQLPKIPHDPEQMSPPSEQPRPEPPRPLTRATFQEHWQRLAEQASLASADSITAFFEQDGQTTIKHMIEPARWPVRVMADLDQYPGKLTIDNADPGQSAPLQLAEEAALRGFDGRFTDGDGMLRRLPDDEPSDAAHYQITAGTLALHVTPDGTYRDQRGLARGASLAQPRLIRTPLRLLDGAAYELASARLACELQVADSRWQFWFRDLPAQAGTFDRQQVRSAKAQDTNDPEARAREHTYLQGYEWRLQPSASAGVLQLFNLRFYPLTLERVIFGNDGVQQIEIIGRLQLPLRGNAEQVDLGNAVRLTFQGAGTALTLSAVSAVASGVEWPLALNSAEVSDAPRLRWRAISLSADRAQLVIDEVELHYYLFGVAWHVRLPAIALHSEAKRVTIRYDFPQQSPPPPLTPSELALVLDLATCGHTVHFKLAIQLGHYLAARSQPPAAVQAHAFSATLGFDLMAGNTTAAGWETGHLFGKLALSTQSHDSAPTAIVGDTTVQFSWQSFTATEQPQLLPGMLLLDRHAPGFAVLGFTATTRPGGVPELHLRSAFVEALLVCRWSSYLHAADPMTAPPSAAQIFGSSAGDLSVGYIGRWHDDAWTESFLLNGLLEIKNLVSWPRAMTYDPLQATLTLPSARRVRDFPATSPLDTFDRRDGGLPADGSWSGEGLAGYRIKENRLQVENGGPIYWQSPRFDPSQEVFVTLTHVDPNGPKQQLLLKAQGQTPNWRNGAIAVGYNAKQSVITLLTFQPGQQDWTTYQDQRIPVTMQDGDRLGARLIDSGGVEVFKNQQLVGSIRLISRDQTFFSGKGGAIGLWFADSKGTIVDQFGGGTVPSTPLAQPRLSHIRHSMRVLLNQHELPSGLLRGGQGALLFTFASGHTWQFLAVVEHQLIAVESAGSSSTAQLDQGVRWTTVQEVRVMLPSTFQHFLRTLAPARTLDPLAEVDELGDASHGYFMTGLHALLSDQGGELERLPADTLLVEATAAHMIKHHPVEASSATTLQSLPTGAQLALLSNPEDYAPSDPHGPEWLLLTMPFLGRLQAAARDGIEQPGSTDGSPLQVDPLLVIERRRQATPDQALPSLALALAAWGDAASIQIGVSSMDTAVGRSLARLDPLALEESWFRLHNPRMEPQSTQLTSVMTALPDTPARLSRPIALRWALDPRRPFYPPAAPANELFPEPSPTALSVWREHSLLLITGSTTLQSRQTPPYGWPIIAAHILSSGLLPAAQTSARYAAATLLPALLRVDGTANPRPLSLAVSPYLSFEWRPAPLAAEPSPMRLRLLLAELLCLDRTTHVLQSVASHLWEVDHDDVQRDEAAVRRTSLVWAEQTQQRLAPESPLAVLRFREINDNTNPDSPTETALTTTYSFALVPGIQPTTRLAQPVFRIRAAPAEVRYREGQHHKAEIPETVHDFEIAPPQTIGTQAIYLQQRPSVTTAQTAPRGWPWGMSALRVSVQYSMGMIGTVGSAQENVTSGMTLWWQAPQHSVDYRSTLHTARPAAGLPVLFRAPAIKSLLPVIPDLPLPVIDRTLFTEPPLAAGTGPERWQPVLPGILRYLLQGARPGVLLTLRHQLISQQQLTFNSAPQSTGTGFVSGSIPAQHRAPRPVPLPANQNTRMAAAAALQTWASYYQPGQNSLITTAPADEAFLAPGTLSGERTITPARRLCMILVQPERGAISAEGDGLLSFDIQLEDAPPPDGWDVALEIADDVSSFSYLGPTAITAPGRYSFTPLLREDVQRWIGSKPAGSALLVRARVQPRAPATGGFVQVLSFPLRVIDPRALPLPLEPYFIYFEDPEYNRRLASPSATASAVLTLPGRAGMPVQRMIRLAAERGECNPAGTLAVRYDWGDGPEVVDDAVEQVTIRLRLVDRDRIPRPLFLPTLPAAPRAGTLIQLAFHEMQQASGQRVAMGPGDLVQVVLGVQVRGSSVLQEVILTITIVEQPVNPTPEAAYALLRWQRVNGQEQVECVRFAWGPQATRVDLVCPDDLRTDVVRRRAVFHFSDVVRPTTVKGYRVQKISPAGSTHFFPTSTRDERNHKPSE